MNLLQRLRSLFSNAFRPRGTDEVMRILHGLAVIDDHLDEREFGFIRSFAERWGFDMGDVLRARPSAHPVEAGSFSALRAAMSDYLAASPPVDQAHQLRDLLTALVTIDGQLVENEEVAMEELARMIDCFTGGDAAARFVVVVVAQDGAQAQALAALVPPPRAEQRGGVEVSRIGEYHTRAYAELVCGWYRDAGYTASIAVADDGAGSHT